MPTTPHLEAQLQHDMDLVRGKLREMAGLVEKALTRAFQALVKGDRQMAYSVILRDQDVDALDAELDRLCLQFILRHQPAAGHLRFVYSASKVVSDLERVGDYAESIARQVLMIGSYGFTVPVGLLSEVANLAIPMVCNAVQAFVDSNADLARTTLAIEPRVNRVRDTITAELMALGERGELPLEALPPLINAARRFERVSDQATNICEEALYVATGVYSRHVPREGFRVLFVDETNGCVSQMAQAIATAMGASRFTFLSAGVAPGPLDPQTVHFLAQKGLDISHCTPRPVAAVPQFDQLQVIVALSREAQKAFPARPSKTLAVDWMVPDPSTVRGTPEQVRQAYEDTFDSLSQHIHDLVQAILGNDEHLTHDTNPSLF